MPSIAQIERLKVLQKRRKEEIVFLQVCEKFITADQQILAADPTHKISETVPRVGGEILLRVQVIDREIEDLATQPTPDE
jgi:hypothetical protein